MSDVSFEPFGVIDIGSNSVRLVLIDGVKRSPASYFNEKVLCGLGRDMAATGRLHEEGRSRALAALRRFRIICEKSGIGGDTLVCFATSAVRDASDGAAFIAAGEGLLGHTIDVLSGDEEALLAAKGVVSGMPQTCGWVADLGGGSLELAGLDDGEVVSVVSYPFGPLRLEGTERGAIRKMLQEAFAAHTSSAQGGTLCLVGGAWRAMAKLHMARCNYPVKVLHHYRLSPGEAREFADALSRKSLKELSEDEDISSRRVDTIAHAALVLRELIDALGPTEVIISAHGVREGIVFERLAPEEKQKDPLLEGARDMAARYAFDASIGEDVTAFAEGFLGDKDAMPPRLVKAACLLSDIAWRDHPNYRRGNILHTVLYAPLDGLTHDERIQLALCLYYRYGGESSGRAKAVARILSPEALEQARVIGALLRFSHTLVGQAPGVIKACAIQQVGPEVVLTVHKDFSGLVGEIVLARLDVLAGLVAKPARVLVSD